MRVARKHFCAFCEKEAKDPKTLNLLGVDASMLVQGYGCKHCLMKINRFEKKQGKEYETKSKELFNEYKNKLMIKIKGVGI